MNLPPIQRQPTTFDRDFPSGKQHLDDPRRRPAFAIFFILTRQLFQIDNKMGDATIEGSQWRLVEVGRVVLIEGNHPYAGRLATIVEIIDHKRVR